MGPDGDVVGAVAVVGRMVAEDGRGRKNSCGCCALGTEANAPGPRCKER
jgi:hypothetical protein